MKIGLIDIDGHNFPNLALMKVSAFHKSQGDSVEWVNKRERFKSFDFWDFKPRKNFKCEQYKNLETMRVTPINL